ncbi:MAG: restriction endonuclease [Gammaproteobacteria bacterium]|nr:restriction endonuclease [Gammaproteobacteria bacterium]MYH15513.1 restriction endonuclease [Gammaproteobacteria bacterium]MYK83741.1 restriction endonuclease [Gammaproteobacteria bacterium]
MPDAFHQSPILNSPYEVPTRHWVLDEGRQPTDAIGKGRREVSFISPIPKPRKAGGKVQDQFAFDAQSQALDADDQQYELTALIDSLRQELTAWRGLPEAQWRVTPETARLLKHWRHHPFAGIRPFFCQVEAVETAIWLTEVAPSLGKGGSRFLEQIEAASQQANPGLSRMALKLATGAGKTAVMAMLIAWQTVNAVRRPNSPRFTRGFLVVAPGITIRDRLRVLQPNDPDSYYASRELVPADMLRELDKAKIVITNYHAFQLRETLDLAKGSRALLQGRGPAIASRETEGQMLARVMPELMTMKGILVLNDEAHHCYREKPGDDDEGKLVGDDRREAERNLEAARVWISGLEAAQSQLGLAKVIDLSATPFFLRGSGYAEGTLFPWTVSDFSLMDAIECGIVKLPRVPVVDNVPDDEMPMYRNLWEHIGKKMPKKGKGAGSQLDPLKLPPELQTALEALYGHYEETFRLWNEAKIEVPPCFIIVCNNTATSKLVYDYVSGFEREADSGERVVHNGRLALFRNFDEQGEPLARPRTLLIDSRQLESGEALDRNFRTAAADEIERFRREIIARTGDRQQAEQLKDEDLLREVMNTVGKAGRLGGGIRCVVSVAMLTEGWDANTVTHVLGLRAFGTQLLCEQVIGRSLRRQSYALNEQGLFDAEYADVFGIPFDFTAKPVVAPPQKPAETVQVKALSPERDHAEIRFPQVAGYRVELPDDQLTADFTEDSRLELTPKLVGPTITHNQGIIGQGHDLTVDHLDRVRPRALLYHLTLRLLYNHWRDPNGEPELHLFGQLKRIAGQWLKECLICQGNTRPAQLMIADLADMACERISAAITRAELDRQPVKAVLDPFNPTGTTRHVNFTTSRTSRYKAEAGGRCHLNWAILDSDWEGELCRILDGHTGVLAWVKNHNLGFEVPYSFAGETRRYIPDFIALIDDGQDADGPLHLVLEVKGYRGEDAKAKKDTMDTYWVPGVNAHGCYGRWAFVELRDVHTMQDDLAAKLEEELGRVIECALADGFVLEGRETGLPSKQQYVS